MGFHHLDQFAHASGAFARIAPAARVLGTFLIAIGAALLPLGAWIAMVLLVALVLAVARYARVPWATLLRRATPPLAFVALASFAVLFLAPGSVVGPFGITDAGVVRFGSALLRGGAAVLAGVLLVSTTRFPELVQGLRELRLPRVVTESLALAFRFLYLLNDEIVQLQRAAASRNAQAGAVSRRRLFMGIAASAVTRSFARSERVHRAMLARGYDGTSRLLHAHGMDAHSRRALLLLGALVTLVVVGARVA